MTWNDDPRLAGMRKHLVDALKIKGIKDERVLDAIGKVPRHAFMESSFVNFAYRDQAFPISAGQTISQPYTVAIQTQLLHVVPRCKILEIGTGSGYQAAILCEMGAKVFTVERLKELYVKAQQILSGLGYRPSFHFGDGCNGLPTYGPFDRIIVTAGAAVIPDELKNQLVIGGRMVIPVGEDDCQEMYVIIRLGQDEFITEKHGAFIFVPLLRGTVS
jgi:protein-L-isoaspartate(D-aspartate) O-methyltransferase